MDEESEGMHMMPKSDMMYDEEMSSPEDKLKQRLMKLRGK